MSMRPPPASGELLDRDAELFLRTVVARASTLQERVKAYKEGATFSPAECSENRAARWSDLLNSGPNPTFEKRLSRLGLTTADLSQVLGHPTDSPARTLPAWATILRDAVHEIRHGDTTSGPPFAKSAGPLADETRLLEQLYLPLLHVARNRLRQTMGMIPGEAIGDAVQEGVERPLSRRLADAGRKLVQVQFAVWQTMVQFGFGSDEPICAATANTSFQNFLGLVPGERLFRLWQEYPVHARQCAVLVDHWVTATARFWRRLHRDHPELSRRFSPRGNLGMVTEVEAGLSDYHHGGQSVLAVTFANGVKLIYKPRSLAAEGCLSRLLSSLGDAKPCGRFLAPQSWDRGNYGWMEHVTAAACSNRAAIRRFYWRAGALLGLVHLARGVDCHRGNLIAAGEHPVLVDADALWHPQDQPRISEGAQANARSSVARPLLRTGFLPGGAVSENMRYTASALEAVLPHLSTPQSDISATLQGGPAPFPHARTCRRVTISLYPLANFALRS